MPTSKDLETKDPDVLLKKIKNNFPKLSWYSFRYLNHGWDHEVIILDEKYVFRFPNSSEYLSIFRDEVGLIESISRKTSVRVPHYSFVAKDYSFGGYEIVPGIELTQEIFGGLSENERASLASQIAEFLTVLHCMPIESLDAYNVVRSDLKKEAVDLRTKAKKYLSTMLNAEDYKKVRKILDDVDVAVKQKFSYVLTHGDISEDHLLWDNSFKKLGVIDFSDRSISDPALDFAELYLYDSAFVEQVFELYKGVKDPSMLSRARVYLSRIGVYLLVDSFITDKISFENAKGMFDKVTTMKYID